jgi:hypothetical protein
MELTTDRPILRMVPVIAAMCVQNLFPFIFFWGASFSSILVLDIQVSWLLGKKWTQDSGVANQSIPTSVQND